MPSPDPWRRAAGRIHRLMGRGWSKFSALRATLGTTALALWVEFLIRRRSLSGAADACGVPLDTSNDESHTQLVHQRVPTPPFSDTEVRKLRSVRRVMRHWPSRSGAWGSGTCLRESLLAGYYLRHRQPVLRVGAGLVDGGTSFHAWIEVSGVDSGAEGFVPLVRMPQSSHG